MTYETVQHPASGETYAVERIDGRIVRAAGPLHHADPTDEESLAAWITNHSDTADDDGDWLRRAVEHGGE